MSGLEGLTRRLMKKGADKEDMLERLVKEFKDIKKDLALVSYVIRSKNTPGRGIF